MISITLLSWSVTRYIHIFSQPRSPNISSSSFPNMISTENDSLLTLFSSTLIQNTLYVVINKSEVFLLLFKIEISKMVIVNVHFSIIVTNFIVLLPVLVQIHLHSTFNSVLPNVKKFVKGEENIV